MRRLALVLLAATALCAPAALAQEKPDPNVPPPGADDPGMRAQTWRPGIRTRLVLTQGRTALVTFPPEEQIKRVVIGANGKVVAGPDPAEVQQAPLANHLPLWAEAEGYTSLQVITAVPFQPDRPYQFAVEVRKPPADGKDDPQATYGLTFTAPPGGAPRPAQTEAQRQERRAQAAEILARRQQEAAAARLRTTHLERDDACDGWLYEARGSRALAPDAVWNNGRETFLAYAAGRPVPAVFAVGQDGAEASVATSVRPATADGREVFVLPFVAPTVRLRLGETGVLDVLDRNPRRAGCDAGTYTPRRDVVRQVRQAVAR